MSSSLSLSLSLRWKKEIRKVFRSAGKEEEEEKKKPGDYESVAVFRRESVERAIVRRNSVYYSIRAVMKGEAAY